MKKILIYSKENCPYCVRAKQLLDSKGVNYEEIRVDLHPEKREELIQRGLRTVPQIFIDGQLIGGCDDLYALEQAGKLNTLLGEKNG